MGLSILLCPVRIMTAESEVQASTSSVVTVQKRIWVTLPSSSPISIILRSLCAPWIHYITFFNSEWLCFLPYLYSMGWMTYWCRKGSLLSTTLLSSRHKVKYFCSADAPNPNVFLLHEAEVTVSHCLCTFFQCQYIHALWDVRKLWCKKKMRNKFFCRR